MVTPRQSQRILSGIIEDSLGFIVDYFTSRNKILRNSELNDYLSDCFTDKGISRRRISRINYDLKRSHYIKIGEGDSVKLTNKAKIRIIEKFASLYPNDGKRRLISFDIPEVKRRERNGFRRTIKQMGFKQIQKSLWVCDKNLSDLVEIAIKEFKVSEYVAYFVIERSNIDKHINKILKNKRVHQR